MSRDFAPPVSSGPFYYSVSSGLWVEINKDTYNSNRHARCSPSRLRSLLTWVDPGPAFTQKGKLKAQLIHYGLKPLTSKAAAKRALLTAIENAEGELKVPDSVKDVERRLKEEYERENVKKEKEYREQKRRREEKKREDSRKRKRVEEELMKEISEDIENLRKKVKTSQGKKSPQKHFDIHNLTGSYRIAAPKVSNGYGCSDPPTFTLAPSSTASRLWGSFHFGVFEGILRSAPLTTIPKIKFQWRGRETGEGVSTYSKENILEVVFLDMDEGKFRGKMYWDYLGTFEVVGKLDRSGKEGLR
ncbi:MAG: hypothetical protein Q9167_002289 [Letrouitia subvulpina]